MDPVYFNIISTAVIAIIGFFLLRYFKSVDKKLEFLTKQMNNSNINFAEIKVEQKSYNEFIQETKTKLDDFINEIRASLERMKSYFEKKLEHQNQHIQENNDEIIRISEREKEFEKKIERLIKIQDNCKYRKN